MHATDSCTLYLRNGEGFTRCYIPACHWQERLADNVLKSGLQNADAVVVYVFAGELDTALRELLSARSFAAQDMLVKGECPFTFDNSTQQKASESLKAFRAAYDVRTVMSLDKLLYGSPELQHFKLSAR